MLVQSIVNIIAYHRKETYVYNISKNDIICFATFTVHAEPTECTKMEKGFSLGQVKMYDRVYPDSYYPKTISRFKAAITQICSKYIAHININLQTFISAHTGL